MNETSSQDSSSNEDMKFKLKYERIEVFELKSVKNSDENDEKVKLIYDNQEKDIKDEEIEIDMIEDNEGNQDENEDRIEFCSLNGIKLWLNVLRQFNQISKSKIEQIQVQSSSESNPLQILIKFKKSIKKSIKTPKSKSKSTSNSKIKSNIIYLDLDQSDQEERNQIEKEKENDDEIIWISSDEEIEIKEIKSYLIKLSIDFKTSNLNFKPIPSLVDQTFKLNIIPSFLNFLNQYHQSSTHPISSNFNHSSSSNSNSNIEFNFLSYDANSSDARAAITFGGLCPDPNFNLDQFNELSNQPIENPQSNLRSQQIDIQVDDITPPLRSEQVDLQIDDILVDDILPSSTFTQNDRQVQEYQNDDIQVEEIRASSTSTPNDIQVDENRTGDIQVEENQRGDIQVEEARASSTSTPNDIQVEENQTGDIQVEEIRASSTSTPNDIQVDDILVDPRSKESDTRTHKITLHSTSSTPSLDHSIQSKASRFQSLLSTPIDRSSNENQTQTFLANLVHGLVNSGKIDEIGDFDDLEDASYHPDSSDDTVIEDPDDEDHEDKGSNSSVAEQEEERSSSEAEEEGPKRKKLGPVGKARERYMKSNSRYKFKSNEDYYSIVFQHHIKAIRNLDEIDHMTEHEVRVICRRLHEEIIEIIQERDLKIEPIQMENKSLKKTNQTLEQQVRKMNRMNKSLHDRQIKLQQQDQDRFEVIQSLSVETKRALKGLQTQDLEQKIRIGNLELENLKYQHQIKLIKLIVRDLRLKLEHRNSSSTLNHRDHLHHQHQDHQEEAIQTEVLRIKSVCKNQENELRRKDEKIFELNEKIKILLLNQTL